MKTPQHVLSPGKAPVARLVSTGGLTTALILLIGLGLNPARVRAQDPGQDEQGEQVLTRGPVHEAFAGVVAFNPEAGVVVTATPPDVIEEIPPEEKPDGDDVAWIPGYWAWDDERNDFLWISGTWRDLPPGREWMAGYWTDTGQGHQWISGYWADETAQETTYLPPPPETLEIGANIEAPSVDYGWTPGCWVWTHERYAWRAGYWAQGRADWVWIPAYYVWTPRGVIYVEGFWDYPVERRGILFAPVYYESRGYARRGYSYSPQIVINLSIFNDHLFVRPRYHHYYFGDYYGSRYDRDGFYASFSYQSRRGGYDPFYSHQRWEQRGDREWEHRFQASYQNRRDNESARPPRTWAAQLTIASRPVIAGQARISIAAPIKQLASRKDSPVRFQPVAREERQQLAQRGREVQKSREQRRTVESKGAAPADRKPGEAITPVKVEHPRSPIVAKPARQAGQNHAPPKSQRGPEPDLKGVPKVDPSPRQPGAQPNRPAAEPRKLEPGKKSPPERNEPAPREPKVQPVPNPRVKDDGPTNIRDESLRQAKDREKNAQQESAQRTREAATKAEQESQRQTKERERTTQQETAQRAKEAAAKTEQESQRQARDREKNAQQESAQRAREAAAKAEQDSQRQTKERERAAQQESTQRAKEAAAKTEQESQRQARDREKNAQQESAQRARETAVKAEQESQRQMKERERTAQQETAQRTREAAAKAEQETQRKAKQVRPPPDKDSERPNRERPSDDDGDADKKDKGKRPGS